jgi:hypothetical protein
MLESGWQEYRGWAARARENQRAATRWALVALLLACVSAIFGALASQDWLVSSTLRSICAFVAAAAAASAPIVGRDILASGREGHWIRARATAEAIKSECFRYAAKLGEYASDAAAQRFDRRLTALAAPARGAGLGPLGVVPRDDSRMPPADMSAEWYKEKRIRDQREFFADRQGRNERAVRTLRAASLFFALAAAVLGAAAAWFGDHAVAPWIAVMTTIATGVAAFGLMERRQFLAASYGAMVYQLDRLKSLFEAGALSFPQLVEATEDLLNSENRTWADRVAQMPLKPPGAQNAGADAAP